jgi:hypothetical protein
MAAGLDRRRFVAVLAALCTERYSLRDLLRHPQRARRPLAARPARSRPDRLSPDVVAFQCRYGLPHYSANEKFSVMIIISALAGGATGTLASMRIIGSQRRQPAAADLFRLRG